MIRNKVCQWKIFGKTQKRTITFRVIYRPETVIMLFPPSSHFTSYSLLFFTVCEGPTFPALHALAARWIPPNERSSFIARSMFGSSIGLVITYPLCGALIPLVGWETTFYVNAGFTLIWFVFWWFLVYDSPETHPFITNSEKDLIETAVSIDLNSKASFKVPWKSILTSVPFIGLMITDSCNTWGLWTLNTNGPTYMKYMLGVDIRTNGLLSGLPMLCRYIGGIFLSSCADWLLYRKYITVVWLRRIFNSISQFGPTCSMLVRCLDALRFFDRTALYYIMLKLTPIISLKNKNVIVFSSQK